MNFSEYCAVTGSNRKLTAEKKIWISTRIYLKSDEVLQIISQEVCSLTIISCSSIPNSLNSTPWFPLLATAFFIFFSLHHLNDDRPFAGYTHQPSQPPYTLELLHIPSAKSQLRIRQPSALSTTASSLPSTAGETVLLPIHAVTDLQFPNWPWPLALLGIPFPLAWLTSFSTAQVLCQIASQYSFEVSYHAPSIKRWPKCLL